MKNIFGAVMAVMGLSRYDSPWFRRSQAQDQVLTSKPVLKRVSEWYERQRDRSREATKRAQEWNKSHHKSRQVNRAEARANTFKYMTEKYPGELRSVRRSMAFELIKNRRQAIKALA